ncbi:MAG TPA: hypothetical protein V6C84_09530 [Coleofasciculaceae cyanobacterium]
MWIRQTWIRQDKYVTHRARVQVQSILALVCPRLQKDHGAESEYEPVVKHSAAGTAILIL